VAIVEPRLCLLTSGYPAMQGWTHTHRLCTHSVAAGWYGHALPEGLQTPEKPAPHNLGWNRYHGHDIKRGNRFHAVWRDAACLDPVMTQVIHGLELPPNLQRSENETCLNWADTIKRDYQPIWSMTNGDLPRIDSSFPQKGCKCDRDSFRSHAASPLR